MRNTYSTLPPAAGSGDLNTCQLFACSLRSGFSLFASASFNLATTASKSAVLSALMKFNTMPASLPKVRAVGAACAACAGAACANTGAADSVPTTSPRAIRNIEASSVERARKGVTLTYLPLHENRHYFVSKEHALAGQPHARPVVTEPAAVEERLQLGAESTADIDTKTPFDGCGVDPVDQPQAREQRVAELLTGCHPAHVNRRRRAARDCLDVVHGGRDVLPPHAAACRVCAAAEPEPLTVGPVLQVVLRPPARARNVRDLVLH